MDPTFPFPTGPVIVYFGRSLSLVNERTLKVKFGQWKICFSNANRRLKKGENYFDSLIQISLQFFLVDGHLTCPLCSRLPLFVGQMQSARPVLLSQDTRQKLHY